jgi:hypothetical protein
MSLMQGPRASQARITCTHQAERVEAEVAGQGAVQVGQGRLAGEEQLVLGAVDLGRKGGGVGGHVCECGWYTCERERGEPVCAR